VEKPWEGIISRCQNNGREKFREGTIPYPEFYGIVDVAALRVLKWRYDRHNSNVWLMKQNSMVDT